MTNIVNTGNASVDALAEMSISGNVTPVNWYKTILRENGKPYLLAICVLSEIVYWYRPVEVRDEHSGMTIGYRKKFREDLLQKTYNDFAEQFGESRRSVKAAFDRLEEIGVIRCEFRNIETNSGMVLNNVKASAEELKTKVVCMKMDIPKNTYVTHDEVAKYFKEISVDMAAVPKSAYSSLTELPKDGFYIENALSKSQMVLKDDIATEDAIMDKYKNGYEITSFGAQAFTGGVNGSLRRGDIVDVYAVDPTTDMLVLMAENVYVYAVYDNTGNKVTSADETATAFTVYVTPEEVEQINMAVCYGGIQMYLKTE